VRRPIGDNPLSTRSPLRPLKKSDFNYDLPPELIAQQPLAERSASRLLVVDVPAQTFADRAFTDLPGYLRRGDLLVFNDTRVLKARLFGRKQTGGAAEILIERVLGTHEALAQIGVSKKPAPGSERSVSSRVPADPLSAPSLRRTRPASGTPASC
jgi:S-adenosylmethionine:tRNA ribosyltransferase-isomerase